MTNYCQRLEALRQAFPQPVSDPVHDGYVVFSILRALDQVDKLKSQAPILGSPRAPDYAAAEKFRLAEDACELEMVVPQLVEYLDGMLNWGHPRSQMNVVPPPSIASIIGVLLPSFYNPNLCSDEHALRFGEAETKAVSATAALVGFDPQVARGVFTFGGTGTMLYAAKVGLEKACPGTLQDGVREEAVVVGSDTAHYAWYNVTSWLGLGQQRFVTVPSGGDNAVDLEALEAKLRELVAQGKKIATLVATMGSTDAFGIDDLEAVVALRDRLVDELALEYRPHVHADAVIGWAWSVFEEYNYDENPLEFRGRVVRALAAAEHRIRHLHLADSLGIDFHKTGFAPYVSSLVLFRDRADLNLITRSRAAMPYLYQTGEWHPGVFTLETSRSACGPMAALANLLLLGKSGLRVLIGHAVDMAEALRERIGAKENLSVLNDRNVGPVTLFRAYPDGVDTFTIKDQESKDPEAVELLQRHNEFNRRIFHRVHEAAMRGEGVAISLTECYRPSDYGVPIVALKSYVLSPFCDEDQMDLVIEHVSAARDEVQREMFPAESS